MLKDGAVVNELRKDERHIPGDKLCEGCNLQLLQQSPGQTVLLHLPHLRRDLLLHPHDKARALAQARGGNNPAELTA